MKYHSVCLCLFTLSLLMLVAAAFPTGLCAYSHAFTCEACHLSAPEEGALILTESMDSFCLNGSCHGSNSRYPLQVVKEISHPSPGSTDNPDILKDLTEWPSDFWLDNGLVNCATCHDPHTDSPIALRISANDTGYCKLCHLAPSSTDPTEPLTYKHLSAQSRVHAMADPEEVGTPGTLDRLSLECQTCHDGSGAKAANYCLQGQVYEGQYCTVGGHPVGFLYQDLNGEKFKATPSPKITLLEKKVGCASCHSIYSHLPGVLVIDNPGSALCFECHRI